MAKGNYFNAILEQAYKLMGGFNEVALEMGKRLDSYIPGKEIASRKFSQLGNIAEDTAKKYIDEIGEKYAPGAIIKPTSCKPDAIEQGVKKRKEKLFCNFLHKKDPFPKVGWIMQQKKELGLEI